MEIINSEIPSNISFQNDSESVSQRLADCLTAKEHFENILKTLKPSDIIVNYKKKIDELARECVAQNLMKIHGISTLIKNKHEYSSILKAHRNNLWQKQQQFEYFINQTSVKLSEFEQNHLNLNEIHCRHLQNILEKAEDIKISVENECSLFKSPISAYALKGDILKNVMENQVTIVSADCSYFLNLVLPVLLKYAFPDYLLILCESCEISASWLQTNVNNFFQILKCNIMQCTEVLSSFHFKTQDTLLAELTSNIKIYKEKFVIILNLPLKRTVVVDLLLCKLRDMLKSEKNSKFILLLSPFDDTAKYENYFAVFAKTSLLVVPSLIFPVKTIWRSSSFCLVDDYKDAVIRTIMAICTFNDSGDILVFLPSQSDAKCVAVELTKNLHECYFIDIECILLHEKSSNESCLFISDERKSLKRKIFISTDSTEMLIIPSVQYIVDSGLKEECLYETNKNLNVLKTTFISHVKAKVRKSLAGISRPGICYRIYNKNNFCKEMIHRDYPEILTVNPTNTIMKLFHYQSDATSFAHFIDPLPEKEKNKAMGFLKKCNLVKDGKLTTLGKKIVKLPFLVKYSKLILQGIQWGLAYEVIIIVAFLTVKASVFLTEDENRQQVIDSIKIQLFQNDSEILSFLYIFKSWLENNCSSSWCDACYVNSHTMNLVSSKVQEICCIVEECLMENIVQNFSDNNCTEIIREMLFDCFLENLCVYTGHRNSGFRVLLSRCIVFIHPSSFFFHKESLPQFIIFDHMMSAGGNFMIYITAIPEDLIMKAITTEKIEYDFSDIFEKTLTKKVIESVSEEKIKEMLFDEKEIKIKEIEDYIKRELNCESVIIEPSVENKCIAVYAMENCIDHVTDIIKKYLETGFKIILNTNRTYELVKGEVKIPIEVKWVKGAKTVSAKFSSVSRTQSCLKNNSIGKSSFERMPMHSVQHAINLTWVRRRIVGYITYFNPLDFTKAHKLAIKNVTMLGTEVHVKVSERNKNEFVVTEIPPNTKQSVFENAVRNLLPNIEFQKVELVIQPPFEMSSKDLREVKAQIQENCENYIGFSLFDIIIPDPLPSASIMEAFINIYDDVDLEYAAEILSNIMIGNVKVTAVPVYRSIIKFNLQVCKLLKSHFEKKCNELRQELIQNKEDHDIFCFDVIELDEESALIKMSSRHKHVIKILRRTVIDVLEGEILNENHIEAIHKLFCFGGHILLKTLEKTENVVVMEDYNSKIIRLYGSQVDCFYAREHIIQFLQSTKSEVMKSIDLCSENGNKMLLKAVIMKYGVNLQNFVESCALRSAALDIRSGHLELIGCQESIEKADSCLKKLSRCTNNPSISDYISEICPVCACPAVNPTFRLEHCRHLYCYECIRSLIAVAHFPIQCSVKDCSKDIDLDDILKILDDKKQINKLLGMSLKDYLEKNSSKFVYCPVPDCSMFFSTDENDSQTKCPLCENDICVNCNVIYHQGYTCDLYQSSKATVNCSFKTGQQTDAVYKACLKCKSAIEKLGNCNHVICISCQSYFCWWCLREFPSSSDVDKHQPYCSEYAIKKISVDD